LIHNPQVLETLKKLNVEVLKEGSLPSNLDGAVVIIRAHGVSPQIEKEIAARGARVIDATCPHVRASQLKARALAAQGYHIFLAGEKNHAEIIGIEGCIASSAGLCAVVINEEEAVEAAGALYKKDRSSKTALIGQTTITPEEFTVIGEALKKYFPAVEIINSICGATRDRQDALRELCAGVDGMIIAGGKQSANTRRLFDIACSEFAALLPGKKAWLVETPGEIPPEAFACSVVGLAAGASTPDEIIDAIEEKLLYQT
jgi:4-hydroxy-3-methylbut-2-enyl diphosphate reductase